MSEFIIVNGELYHADELYHHGIKGMKWGRRKKDYRSTSIRSAIARRSNEKVDKSFKKWQENTKKRDSAIGLGKEANLAKLAYERDKSNKELKSAYKTANKQYKKALSKNTAYRKGVVRQEVGRDIARKYLSEAKKIKKQMTSDPSNKALKKKYDDLMSKHDIERSKSRKAASVGQKRSQKIASVKRTMTITATAVAGSVAVAAGVYAVNSYLNNHNVTVNGRSMKFGAQHISNITNAAKNVRSALGYVY